MQFERPFSGIRPPRPQRSLSSTLPSTSNALSSVPSHNQLQKDHTVSLKTEQQCLQPQRTYPRKSHCTFPHLHKHSSLGLWPTCSRNAGLRPQNSPWRPPRLKHVTGVAIQELLRAEMGPINFHKCHLFPTSLQPLQPTKHSGISATQRAAMARASDLTWGSNHKPQKLPCFRIDITRAPVSALAA